MTPSNKMLRLLTRRKESLTKAFLAVVIVFLISSINDCSATAEPNPWSSRSFAGFRDLFRGGRDPSSLSALQQQRPSTVQYRKITPPFQSKNSFFHSQTPTNFGPVREIHRRNSYNEITNHPHSYHSTQSTKRRLHSQMTAAPTNYYSRPESRTFSRHPSQLESRLVLFYLSKPRLP